MLTLWHFFTVGIAFSIIPATNCLICDGPSEVTTTLCNDILNEIERALLADESNLFRMRRAFFHSPTASPVLIKVVYNLTFSNNLTIAADKNEISHCSSSEVNSTIDFNQQNITYGWTSSGVYTAFHPIVLNMMQAHTPFALLRINHYLLDQRGPEADTFLWDGSYDLPSLHLNIHITSISCAPSRDLFHSVLRDFNTLLKVYAERQDKLRFEQKQDSIGFTLPNTSVSTNIDPHGSDVIMAILYSFAFCFMYSLSVLLLVFWYFRQRERHQEEGRPGERQLREGNQRKGQKDNIVQMFENNRELIGGILMTAIIAIAFEICIRISNVIIWSVHSEISLGNFKAVWLPHIFLFLFAAVTNTVGHIYICYKKRQEHNRLGIDKFRDMFMSKVHVVLALQLMAFGLLYCFYPAIILALVYPTRMTVIFTFVPAYLFVNTVVVAILIKFFRLFEHENEEGAQGNVEAEGNEGGREENGGAQTNDGGREENGRPEENVRARILKFFTVLTMACILMFFLYAISLTFLYSVIVGSGSAVNTGPLFIISLIPSILIMIVAWIADRIVLNGSQNLLYGN